MGSPTAKVTILWLAIPAIAVESDETSLNWYFRLLDIIHIFCFLREHGRKSEEETKIFAMTNWGYKKAVNNQCGKSSHTEKCSFVQIKTKKCE